MPYEITYVDKDSGARKVHTFEGNRAGAFGWSETLSRENDNCPTEIRQVDSITRETRVIGGKGKLD